MKLHYGEDEMLEMLEAWGYEMRNRALTIGRSVGPGNDVEYHKVTYVEVWHGGRVVCKADTLNDPVEEVFEREFKRRIWRLIK